MRLAKRLAMLGISSRRESEKLIQDGRVLVNGTLVRGSLTLRHACTRAVPARVYRRGHTYHAILEKSSLSSTTHDKTKYNIHYVSSLICVCVRLCFIAHRLRR